MVLVLSKRNAKNTAQVLAGMTIAVGMSSGFKVQAVFIPQNRVVKTRSTGALAGLLKLTDNLTLKTNGKLQMLKYSILPILMISTPALAERVIDTQQYFEGLRTSCSIQADVDRGITTNSITTNIVCGNGQGGNCYAAGDRPHEGYQSCNTFNGRSGGAEGLNNAINWVLNNM